MDGKYSGAQQMITQGKLRTVGSIAKELDASIAQINYAIDAYKILHVQRAGIIRLYDHAGVEAIRSALNRIEANRTGRQ